MMSHNMEVRAGQRGLEKLQAAAGACTVRQALYHMMVRNGAFVQRGVRMAIARRRRRIHLFRHPGLVPGSTHPRAPEQEALAQRLPPGGPRNKSRGTGRV